MLKGILRLAHSTRLKIQPLTPKLLLGLGAYAKVLYRTRAFSSARKLRSDHAAQLRMLRDEPIRLGEFERSILSQNGEDGILEAIFQVIGFRTCSTLEFGFAATEATLLSLALTHNLNAYFMDGSHDHCELARSMFRVMGRSRVRVAQAFITAQNINETISALGLIGDIDALSIDVDGNDYWLWQALEVVRPRLVIAEYNDRLGPTASVTIAYDPSFDLAHSPHEIYQGASLTALTKLAGKKGYRLIGCDSAGVNAFFLRNDINAPSLPRMHIADAFRYQQRTLSNGPVSQEADVMIATLPFVHV